MCDRAIATSIIVSSPSSSFRPKQTYATAEIHTLVGAGSAEGGIDAANMLKPALARGKLQVIGATTISEYRKYMMSGVIFFRASCMAPGSRSG